MNARVPARRLILVAAVIGALAIGGLMLFRSRRLSTAELLQRMPTIESLVVYIDFDKLRQAGMLELLDGSKAGEDPEYRAFAQKTDFHWAKDLDTAILAVAPSGKYILAQGRFNWKSLHSYVQSQGGNCDNNLCKLQGSTPDRKISFVPLQGNVMAMAIAPDDGAALRLTGRAGGPEPDVPAAPVWLSIPSSVLRSDTLPEGTVSFARSVADADRVTLALVPEKNRMAAKLTVLCRNQDDARRVVEDLDKKTEILRSMIAHAHATPGPADIAGVLASGSFQASGRKVFGYWPIETAFMRALLGASPSAP